MYFFRLFKEFKQKNSEKPRSQIIKEYNQKLQSMTDESSIETFKLSLEDIEKTLKVCTFI